MKKPSKLYLQLIRLSEILFRHCTKYQIKIIAQFGSLLGLIRDQNIILWDYDGDYAVFSEQRQKLLQSFSKQKYQNAKLAINLYGDEGKGCMGFVSQIMPEAEIDIVFYQIRNNIFQHLMSQQIVYDYPTKSNYIYNAGQVVPIKKALFLGYQIYIPNKPEKVLDTDYQNWDIPQVYSFQQFEQQKIITPNQIFQARFLNPPLKKFQKIQLVKQSLNLYKNHQPIVIKNSMFQLTIQEFAQLQLLLPIKIQSFQKILEKKIRSKKMVQQISSSNIMHHYPDYKNFECMNFHILLSGREIIWYISKQYINELIKNGIDIKNIQSLDQLISVCDYYLWNKIHYGYLEKGQILIYDQNDYVRFSRLEEGKQINAILQQY